MPWPRDNKIERHFLWCLLILRIAEVAFQVNENTENIGARRLHTVMERLLENISFEASDKSGSNLQVDADYVDEHLAELSKDEDLSRYIL